MTNVSEKDINVNGKEKMSTSKKIIEIFVIDDQPPEAGAMLHALYSRDPRSVMVHLERVRVSGPEKFMGQYYVGYAHKSIGDCGTVSIFIEQVSLLTAKAVQEWPLYSGQEASTRYLNMFDQGAINPLGTVEGELIQATWMDTYKRALERLIPFLTEKFPKKPEDDQVEYTKAIKAKAFDIARGLLPGGARTLLSWHTNLRQAWDHLHELNHHPLLEVREVTGIILSGLKQKYPSSFSHKIYPKQEDYLDKTAKALTYYDREVAGDFSYFSRLDMDELMEHKDLLISRPERTELPHQLRIFGGLKFKFPLDFGSFRDLQRHRSGARMMPLLTTRHGFFPWYLDQLPHDLRAEVEQVIEIQKARVNALDCTPEIRQYYTAIGYTVACYESFSLPGAVYVAELRAGQTVHPTFRRVAQQMTEAIREAVPGIALHSDMGPEVWTIKRGKQDIVKKPDAEA